MSKRIDTIIFVTLCAVVAMRPLITETYDYRTDSIALATADIADPTPLRTLTFNVVILVCGLLLLVARAVGPPHRWHRSGLAWGSMVLVIAAVISCAAAGQNRIAITASLDWLCYPVLAITLIQVMRTRLHRRVLVAAIVASASVQAFSCYEQYAYSFEETWQTYLSHKDEFWARQGVETDSSRVEMFERRMQAREASGTFYHSNIAGSYLALCGIVALSLSVGKTGMRRFGRASPRSLVASYGSVLVAAAVLGAVFLTGSLGAMITGIGGVLSVLLLWRFGPTVAAYRRRLFVGAWLLLLFGIATVVGYGTVRGALPGSSLNFRWHYWINATAMIVDHPITGVGRENFGRHYLGYKPITSAEEVSNPHNVLVHAAAEWGFSPGLIGVLMLIYGASRVLAGMPSRRDDSVDAPATLDRTPPDSELSATMAALLLTLVGAAVVVGRVALSGSANPPYLYYTGMTTGLIWSVAAAALVAKQYHACRESDPTMLAVGCAVAVGMFVIHELVNFALFVPATATTMFAVLAVGCAERGNGADRASTTTPVLRWASVVGFAAFVGLAMIVAVVPPFRSSAALAQAERQARLLGADVITGETALQFDRAVAADSLDSNALWAWLGWLRQAAASPDAQAQAFDLAEAVLDEAIRRDPYNRTWYQRQMNFYKLRGELGGGAKSYGQAVAAAEAGLGLYPQHPRGLVALAECRMSAGEAAQDTDLIEGALTAYARALALDSRRPPGEVLHRLTAREIADIEAAIARGRRLLVQTNQP